jgi:hypothetical protein
MVIYTVSYLRGIVFNWVKTYVKDFIVYKNNDSNINILARVPT